MGFDCTYPSCSQKGEACEEAGRGREKKQMTQTDPLKAQILQSWDKDVDTGYYGKKKKKEEEEMTKEVDENR